MSLEEQFAGNFARGGAQSCAAIQGVVGKYMPQIYGDVLDAIGAPLGGGGYSIQTDDATVAAIIARSVLEYVTECHMRPEYVDMEPSDEEYTDLVIDPARYGHDAIKRACAEVLADLDGHIATCEAAVRRACA